MVPPSPETEEGQGHGPPLGRVACGWPTPQPPETSRCSAFQNASPRYRNPSFSFSQAFAHARDTRLPAISAAGLRRQGGGAPFRPRRHTARDSHGDLREGGAQGGRAAAFRRTRGNRRRATAHGTSDGSLRQPGRPAPTRTRRGAPHTREPLPGAGPGPPSRGTTSPGLTWASWLTEPSGRREPAEAAHTQQREPAEAGSHKQQREPAEAALLHMGSSS